MLGVTEMHSREEDRLNALRAMLRGQDGPGDTLELMATATSSSLYLLTLRFCRYAWTTIVLLMTSP